ncbi:unnamed protein product [Fraxinus pennsylvanica]|uniref:glutathione transferase n=1 Tax=Fraxinus pennsylvanica TaxID=56036 RepID=A0AAD1YVZ8_9LAMI|nr:unnamed protein product [Fraxinus pennsylvanica]
MSSVTFFNLFSFKIINNKETKEKVFAASDSLPTPPHQTWAKKKAHPHGQIYGYRMSLWAEHMGNLDDCLKEPGNPDCVKYVNRTAETNWKKYVADEFTLLQGHLLKYAVDIDVNGKVNPLPGYESFPDVGGNWCRFYYLRDLTSVMENGTQPLVQQKEQEEEIPSTNLSILPMASAVKVYGPPLSAAVSRVLTCLLEKDVQFQLIPINLVRGEQKKPDYLKLQPFGQVPVFQDESITLFESRAISRYVCDKYANQGNKGLFGTNPLEKASIDQWLEVEGQNFYPPTAVLVFQLAFVPRMKIKQDENLIKQNEEKLGKVLDVYENRLGESGYLAGDEFTLADLSHLPMLHYLVNQCGRGELLTSRKNVGRWWDEISSRETWKKVIEMRNSPPQRSA